MLLYFILGIVFIYIFIPIIDNLLAILSTLTEYINYKIAVKVYELKKKYNIEVDDDEEENSNPIGFVCTEMLELPDTDEEDEDNEEGIDQNNE